VKKEEKRRECIGLSIGELRKIRGLGVIRVIGIIGVIRVIGIIGGL